MGRERSHAPAPDAGANRDSPTAVLSAPFHEVLLAAAESRGDKPALVEAETGRTLRYSELAGFVDAVASDVKRRGLRPGEVVALLSRNVPEYVPLLLGVLRAGGVVTPVNPHLLPREIAAQLERTGASFLASTGNLREAHRRIVPDGIRAGPIALEVLFGGIAGPTRLAGAEASRDAALLAWSVGRGGFPAPARLSHRNLCAALHGLARVAPWTPDDIVFSAISPYDLYGFVSTLALALRLGLTAVVASRFDVPSFAGAVARHRVTVSNVVPTIVAALADAPPLPPAPLRLLISGGAPLSPAVAAACAERQSIAVIQGYGLAEAAGATHVDAAPPASDPASCGRPIDGTTQRVVDSSGRDVAAGEVGELWLQGDQVFDGYSGDATKTGDALSETGFLRTGDLVREIAGRITVVGRAKRLVKVKGFQVSPAEIELALSSHPAVAAASVVPTWDDRGEESPVARVALRKECTESELQGHLAALLARYKRPSRIHFVSEVSDAPAVSRFPWSSSSRST